jgi:hypothetical protein
VALGATKVLVVNLAREASKVVVKAALVEVKVALAEVKVASAAVRVVLAVASKAASVEVKAVSAAVRVVLAVAKAASAVVRVVSGAKRDLAEMAELESDLSYSNRANPIALLGAMGFFYEIRQG